MNDKLKEKSKSVLTVAGYKSFYTEQSIEFRPLTILAGANSSGKSSIIQPLLLLKQTLDVSYDPGALLLSGANVKFTTFEQLLSKRKGKNQGNSFFIKFEDENNQSLELVYRKIDKEIEIDKMNYFDRASGVKRIFYKNMPEEEIKNNLKDQKLLWNYEYFAKQADVKWSVKRDRCFLYYSLEQEGNIELRKELDILSHTQFLKEYLKQIIHLPGLRGNPERIYKTTAVEKNFPGVFQDYFASIINDFQINNSDGIFAIGRSLEKLGLTWKVEAKKISDTQIELMVARLPSHKGKSSDMVNIVDVGFGVSQVLPVIVALLIAAKGQMVYIEQPELHLHPKAQVNLAEIISESVKRGVLVVIETHSPILLLGIQTLVAEKKLSPDLVKLHWFTREKDGRTEISSVDIDENGSYGDWPEDFGDVELKLESRYLDAT